MAGKSVKIASPGMVERVYVQLYKFREGEAKGEKIWKKGHELQFFFCKIT